MPRARRSDGDATKARILDAAGQLIAQNGWAQTTNKAIAKMAEADLAAINYHFEGRDGLYRAVLIEAHAHYLNEDRLREIADSDVAAEDKLGILFETLIAKLHEKDVWHGKVFIREIFTPSPHLFNFFENEGARKFQIVRRIIASITGLNENDPKILPCIFSVIAPCLILLMTGMPMPGPMQALNQLPSKQLAQHFKVFSLAGLQAIAAQPTESAVND